MVMSSLISASEFAERKLDLPEGGRWHELHDGQTVIMEAPDDDHGNAVLNLSRALAQWLQTRVEKTTAYACHEIGLHVTSDPDSVYCPAISFFGTGKQFEQSDKLVADAVPDLVIDIASANDRRRDMRRRTLSYIELGVHAVWVPDPMKKEVQVITSGEQTVAIAGRQLVESPALLPGFQIPVSNVFAQPEWWK